MAPISPDGQSRLPKNPIDTPAGARSIFPTMAQSEVQLIRKSDFIVDIVIVGAFFAFMFSILRVHVPSLDPTQINLWAAGTAACMSGVFWLAAWMFRVVFRYQKELNARK